MNKKCGPIAYRDLTIYSEEETAYLRAIQDYVLMIRSQGRVFPTNMEIARVILRVAHELGYRKLVGFELMEYDKRQSQREITEQKEKKRDTARVVRRNREDLKRQGAATRWKEKRDS